MDKADLSLETRMALAESWINTHDKACAERWRELKHLLTWGGGLAVSLVIAVAGWGLNKTWEGQQQQLHALQALQARMSVPPAPGG